MSYKLDPKDCEVDKDILFPFVDQDKIEVFDPIGMDEKEPWVLEYFDKDRDCEVCSTDAEYPKGAFFISGDENSAGLCFEHLKETYAKIRVVEQIRPFVYVWQRGMNSGIVELDPTTIQSVRKAAWLPEHVKSTIIVGKIVEVFGVDN